MALATRNSNKVYQLPVWDSKPVEFNFTSEYLIDSCRDRNEDWENFYPTTGLEIYINGDTFRLLKKIGRGSSKDVFEAIRITNGDRDQQQIKKVAALFWKVKSKECLENVSEESRCFDLLKDKPGVIQIFNKPERVGKYTVFAACELCDHTFNSWSKDKAVIFRLQMIQKVAKILLDLHINGIAHGDLKPENIGIIEEDVRLLDVGSVTDRGHDKDSPFKGTLSYAPPSSYKGEDSPIERDVFALGVMIYESLQKNLTSFSSTLSKANPPHHAAHGVQLVTQTEVNNILAHLPEPVSQFLSQILEMNPEKRMKIDQVVRGLEKLILEINNENFFGFTYFDEREKSDDFFSDISKSIIYQACSYE